MLLCNQYIHDLIGACLFDSINSVACTQLYLFRISYQVWGICPVGAFI